MEGNGRKLGWIAIALGALALVVALSGRGHSPGGWYGQPPVPFVPRGESSAPHGESSAPRITPPDAPSSPGWHGPEQGFGPRRGGLSRHEEYRWFAHQHPFGFGPLGFLFGPFFMFGGLARTLLFLLLIFLAVRFFKRRSDGPRGPGGEPPYTADTQSL